MLPPFDHLRILIQLTIQVKDKQGYEISGLGEKLARIGDSYDALWEFSTKLNNLPYREDWPYVEPNSWEEIEAELTSDRPRGNLRPISTSETAGRIETAFLSSVCGCMLGKPVEVDPTLDELRTALEAIGEWPLNDYFSSQINVRGTGTFHSSHAETVRENLRYAAPDDDINYTILGMLLLETHGASFTHDQLAKLWLLHVPVLGSWGAERNFVGRASLHAIVAGYNEWDEATFAQIRDFLNPADEACGAMIRADAYGYACPGDPALAAWLAWKDARLTHRGTGVYGTMYAAAAIAAAPVVDSPLEIFEIAMKYVPRRSRFYKIVSDSLTEVAAATDWLDGYGRINKKYSEYRHCRVYQESGTLINSLRFAENIGDGICKQVMQGNDTDSYGATCGSILGNYFGPGHLDDRWLAPLNDTIHTTLAGFHEQSLSRVAKRMSNLPEILKKGEGDSIDVRVAGI